jgi:hypothetical protein
MDASGMTGSKEESTSDQSETIGLYSKQEAPVQLEKSM